jgi:hypothetical protein
MTARWTCSFAHDCAHRWRWTARVHQHWRRWRRRIGLIGLIVFSTF